MNYEIITIPAGLNSLESNHVVVTREDGSFESFPADETNPRYIQFLAELEEQA